MNAQRRDGPKHPISLSRFAQCRLKPCAHTVRTAQPHARVGFRRAIERRALWMAEDAARELPNLPLAYALQLVHLYFERGSPRAEPAARRWLVRNLSEGSPSLRMSRRSRRVLRRRARGDGLYERLVVCRRGAHAPVNHLALAVSDQGRSTRFYVDYFGFVPEPEPREDGVVIDPTPRISLALGEIQEPVVLPPFLHFGRGVASPGEVRSFRGSHSGGWARHRRVVGRAGLREREVPRPGRLRHPGRVGRGQTLRSVKHGSGGGRCVRCY